MLLLSMFVVQGVARGRFAGTTASALGLGVWCVSSVALVACLVVNRKVPGTIVAAAGILLNLDVVLLNGGMPLLVPAGPDLAARGVLSTSAGFYHLAGAATLWLWAADAVDLNLVGQRLLISAGDILLAVGVVVIIVASMTRDAAGSEAV